MRGSGVRSRQKKLFYFDGISIFGGGVFSSEELHDVFTFSSIGPPKESSQRVMARNPFVPKHAVFTWTRAPLSTGEVFF